MAGAAGTALLRSMATKMGMTVAPRAPSFRHPLFVGLRGRRPFSSSSSPSGSTPPPTNNKDLSQNNNVHCELNSTKATYMPGTSKVAYFLLFSTLGYLYLYFMPKLEELSDKMAALSRTNSILIEALQECQRTHSEAKGVLADSSQSRCMQSLGQVKQNDDGQQVS
ncbi:unnamed protein product [Urochloa humidicola]